MPSVINLIKKKKKKKKLAITQKSMKLKKNTDRDKYNKLQNLISYQR